MEEIIPNRSTAHTKVLFSKQKKTCEYVQHWFSDICLQIEFLWKPRNCQILGNLKLDIGQKDTDMWYMKTSADLNQCWILDIRYSIFNIRYVGYWPKRYRCDIWKLARTWTKERGARCRRRTGPIHHLAKQKGNYLWIRLQGHVTVWVFWCAMIIINNKCIPSENSYRVNGDVL